MDGRLRDLAVVVRPEAGRTVGDRSCGGGSGVVGEAGWENAMDASRSPSRTGLMKLSEASIDGTAAVRGCAGML
jgi:hypothetical protein